MTIASLRLSLLPLLIAVLTIARLWPMPVQAQPIEPPQPIIITLIATPTAQPIEIAPVAEPPPVVVEQAPMVEAAPQPVWVAPVAEPPPPVWINDPAQNGGNVPPDGCTFPITGNECANGAQLIDRADGSRTNDRADRPQRSDPPHKEDLP